MQALANFVLRGRSQACLSAFLGSFLPLLGPACIGLVALSKGVKEGLLIFLWVSLPLLLLHLLSADSAFLTALSLLSLGLLVVAAAAHSLLASWQWTIIVTVITAAVLVLLLGVSMSAEVSALLKTVENMMAEIAVSSDGAGNSIAVTRPLVLGLIAMALSLASILSLMISRWWQALVYNPGGFQQEFHGFVVDRGIAIPLVVIIGGGQLLPEGYQFWTELASLPLLIAGFALIHFAVKLFQLGSHWLTLLYVALILFGAWISMLLITVAAADSFLDLRSRLADAKNRQS